MHDAIIIGAGLSGLACAIRLREQGLEPIVLEADSMLGGRVRTDRQDGFLLDRGFQVLQTWYPEARRMLDYERLDLRPFYPGALVRWDGRLHRVSDIWRRPWRLPEMLVSPVGSVADKLRLFGLRRDALRGSMESLYDRPEEQALAALKRRGFSDAMIDRFIKPFFAGVFFAPELDVSSRAFDFVFRAFALGDSALPAQGMGAIPEQLGARLPDGCVRFNARVERVADDGVVLDTGEQLKARAIVVATDGPEAARLLGRPTVPESRGTTTLYFAADAPAIDGPYLVLNAEGKGMINSLLCPSNLSPHYAPEGRHLIAVNLFGAERDPEQLQAEVSAELLAWFGERTRDWQPLASYRLARALPMQRPPVESPLRRDYRYGERLWSCSEYEGAVSTNWALHAGSQLAHALSEALGAEGTHRSPA